MRNGIFGFGAVVVLVCGCALGEGLRITGERAGAPGFEDRSMSSTYQYDHGGSTSLQWTTASTLESFEMQRFDAAAGGDAIESISVAWGNVPAGAAGRVFVWGNPTGDGNPTHVTLLHEQSVTVGATGYALNTYTLSRAIPVSGVFFVGMSVAQRGYSDSPMVIDTTTAYVEGRSFIGYSTGVFDAADPGNNASPPADIKSKGFPYYVVVRAGGSNAGFSYQGRLSAGGANYTGSADFRFTLYDAPSGGNALTGVYELSGVAVSGGVFSVRIPASSGTFVNQAEPYVDVAVATPSGSGNFQTLLPRGRVTSVPSALTVPWAGVTGVPEHLSPWTEVTGGIGYGGMVGIRTGAPGAALDVWGGGSGTPSFPQLHVAAEAAAPYGSFLSLDARAIPGGKEWLVFSSGGSALEGAGKLIFKNQTSAVYGLTLDGGLVGIGNTNPSVSLDILRSTNGNMLRMTSDATDASILSLINTSAGGRNYSLLSQGSALNPGSFSIRDVSSSADRLTIFPNGRIGMGSTSTPAAVLDVTANGGSTTAIAGRAGPGPSAVGIYGWATGPGPKAAIFDGPVVVNGTLTVNGSVSKTSGSFRIPHPLDPEGKWLYHSFVESPDMMNVYNGIIVLDGEGRAVVELPDYFQALNSDYRYQLTAVGASMPGLYVAREIEKNRFEIAGGKAGAKVSWQVTGIRQDEAAKRERIVPERERAALDP
ncbi:MAG: hypothetical protein U0573_03205 [Phycisphaerales bacterium]|nr:hypothetical protein [Planctomycetota bacterium]